MFPLPHMLVGAAVGRFAGAPLVAFGLGFLTHQVLDALPHFDGQEPRRGSDSPGPHPWHASGLRRAAVEILVATALLAWLVAPCPLPVRARTVAAVLGALLPDLVDLPLQRRAGIALLHVPALHWRLPLRHALVGTLSQGLVALAALAWLLKASCR